MSFCKYGPHRSNLGARKSLKGNSTETVRLCDSLYYLRSWNLEFWLPWWPRIPNFYLLSLSILAGKNPMDREAWRAIVHGVTKSRMHMKRSRAWVIWSRFVWSKGIYSLMFIEVEKLPPQDHTIKDCNKSRLIISKGYIQTLVSPNLRATAAEVGSPGQANLLSFLLSR